MFEDRKSSNLPRTTRVVRGGVLLGLEKEKVTEETTWNELLLDPECRACSLWQGAQTVCLRSDGSEHPRVLFVGEAPGKEEDRLGRPFIGRSGELLREAIAATGVSDEYWRIANSVRCIPWETGQNKITKPSKEQIAACRKYLIAEIVSINPELIVLLGNTALESLLGRTGVTSMRGSLVTKKIDGKPYEVYVTVHPASVLYSQRDEDRIRFFQDIKDAFAVLDREKKAASAVTYLDTYKSASSYLEGLLVKYESGELKIIAVDVETEGLSPFVEKTIIGTPPLLHCISIAYEEGRSAVIPWDHPESPFSSSEKAKLKPLLKKVLETIPCTGQNYKYDYKWLKHVLGIDTNIVFDTMLASYFIYSRTVRHGLKYQAHYHLGLPTYTDAIDEFWEQSKLKKEQQGYFSQLPMSMIYPYAGCDADYTLRLTNLHEQKLREEGLLKSYRNLMIFPLKSLADAELSGAYIEPQELAQTTESYAEYLAELEDFINGTDLVDEMLTFEAVKTIINKSTTEPVETKRKTKKEQFIITSKSSNEQIEEAVTKYPEQIGQIRSGLRMKPTEVGRMKTLLFDYMGLPIVKRTKTGAASTDRESLDELETILANGEELSDSGLPSSFVASVERNADEVQEKKDLLRALKEYKTYAKVYGTYLDGMKRFICPGDLVHCTYNQSGTATGRMSCSDPSLHTIPWHSDAKKIFQSRWKKSGGLVVELDYSQMEVRILAAVTQDPGLCAAYESGQDVHTYVASQIYKIPYSEDFPREKRRHAKITTFRMIYGGGAESLAKDTGLSLQEAESIMREFFKSFPRVREYLEEQKAFIEQHGYCESIFGRRRVVDQVEFERAGRVGRIGINTPIQASCSDMTLLALARQHARYKREGLRSILFGFVHDSLDDDVYPGELLKVLKIAKEEMEETPRKLYKWLNVPVKTDMEVGISWGHLCKAKILDEQTLHFEGVVDYFNPLVEACTEKLGAKVVGKLKRVDIDGEAGYGADLEFPS